ncbi:putative gustatory receptor 28a isoform X2 [Diachasmimorpha longicaudata]|uniref:putative gustatory receptor 28a isoform X2 n=1 Tax=Diachasmimorpha longicaudata TaxID=58733 RepID=UPI0030B8DFA2
MYSKKSLLIFKFTHMISFILGLAPYSVEILPRLSKKSGVSFRIIYSRLGCAYNILLALIFVGITVIVRPYLIDYQYPNDSVLTMIVATVTTLGNIFSIILIVYYTHYQQHSVDISKQLSKFDEIFTSEFGNTFDNEKTNRFTNIDTWLPIFLISFLWCGAITTSTYIQQSRTSIANIFSVLIMTSVVMQYGSVVDSLRRRLKNLNELLPSIFKCPISNIESVHLVRIAANNRLVNHNFTMFKKLRNKLYKISCLVADFYSFPTLLTVVHSFCASITTFYFFIISIVQEKGMTVNAFYLNVIFWFFLCIYPTIRLSRSVRIFNKELNNFAVEQIHKKVEFTACGFFSLDCTLLQSMFGAFVTYLLIILQFKPKDVMQN